MVTNSDNLGAYAPRLLARVRHLDTDCPVEIRVVDGDDSTTSYGLTPEQATLLLAQLERAVRQVVTV
ncbi:MAG: hypothetical protein LW627_12050 [Ilumatobacteraceae bacterium]|nr:hypothetical protein [Ilumatobacteraceae bacterium]